MRKFKTICHNNIHKGYDIVPNNTMMLWRDPRPSKEGIMKCYVIDPKTFEPTELYLEVGKEYFVTLTNDYVSVSILPSDNSLPINFSTESGPIILTQTDTSILGICYTDFFYSEEQMRDNKISEVLKNK